MRDFSFLSDNINFNNQFAMEPRQEFISDRSFHDKNNSKVRSFEIKNYQEKINKNCIVKSATSKKWSIKFK